MRVRLALLMIPFLLVWGGLLAGDARAQAAPRTGTEALRATAAIQHISANGGRTWITRSNARREENAIVGEFLYPGDYVHVRGEGAKVELLIRGRVTPMVIGEGESPYLVTGASQPSIARQVVDYMNSMTWPWIQKRKPRRGHSYTRDVPSPGATAPKYVPVRYSPALPGGDVIVPRSLDHLTVAWCGDAAYGEAHSMDGDVREVPDEANIGRVRQINAPIVNRVLIHDLSSSNRLVFNVRRVASRSIPRPDWLIAEPRSAEERVAWGVWLLREEAPAYRAYGLTLLDDSRVEFPAAEQFLDYVTECTAPEP